MIFITGVLIVYEAIKALIEPHNLQQLDTGMVLVMVAAAVNFVLGYWCISVGKKNNSLALEASGKHLQSDTYTTLGIVVGIGLIYLTEQIWIDSVVAMLFAGLLLFTGFKIIRASVSGIMDEQDTALMGRVVEVLNRHRRTNWVDLHNARIIKFGPVLHLDCHLTVPWYFTVQEAHHEVVELTRLVRKEFGPSVELFVHSDFCEEFSCPVCIKNDCTLRKAAFQKQMPWSVSNISSTRKHDAGTA
jgi:cation diffusion facilitator family transporter